MTSVLVAWGICFAVLAALALLLGKFVSPPGLLGILIDGRGRYSLTHFQTVVWSLAIVSLIGGLFFGRVVDNADDPLGFTIPSEVLALLGISIGSGVLSTAAKTYKDSTAGDQVAASDPELDPPFLAQIFMLEEGTHADRAVDIAKFQNFAFTVILVVAYVVLAVESIQDATTINDTSMPDFSPTFLTLLGISHAAYVANKLPTQTGTPDGPTVDRAQELAQADELPADMTPRNPRARRQVLARRAADARERSPG